VERASAGQNPRFARPLGYLISFAGAPRESTGCHIFPDLMFEGQEMSKRAFVGLGFAPIGCTRGVNGFP